VSAVALPLVVLAAFLGTAWLAAVLWFPLWGAMAARSPALARGSIHATALPAVLGLVLVAAAVLPLDPHLGLVLRCHCGASLPGWMHLCPLHPAQAAPLVGPALAVVLLLVPGRLRQLRRVARTARPFGILASPGGSAEPLVLPLPQRTALVTGVLRPRVVVDRDLWDVLSPEDRAVVVAHEQGHVHRRDPLVLAVLGVLSALGPPSAGDAVVRAWLRRAELAADRVAAAHTDPVQVAEALVRCARLQQGAAVPLSCGGGALEQRVRHLLALRVGPRDGGGDLARADGMVLAAVAGAAIALGSGLHHPLEHLLNLGR
jgi:Zn-dependent protease with chaperone function